MNMSAVSNSRLRPCQVAVLTPPGRGAVATLVVFGPLALDTIERLFVPAARTPLSQFPFNRVIYGHWLASQTTPATTSQETANTETLLVVRRDEQWLEVHCHGGSAAVGRILRSLAAEHCPRVSPASWLRRHAHGRLASEARLAIAEASTARVAAILLDQLQGSLSRAVDAIVQHLAAEEQHDAEHQLAELLRWGPLGRRLVSPWRIALVGETNVGKSSLINAILGYARALVQDTPGTTRDVLTDLTAIDGWPVELADTAGMRATESAIEREGVRRARERATTADLVYWSAI